jgi:hypothetical protein
MKLFWENYKPNSIVDKSEIDIMIDFYADNAKKLSPNKNWFLSDYYKKVFERLTNASPNTTNEKARFECLEYETQKQIFCQLLQNLRFDEVFYVLTGSLEKQAKYKLLASAETKESLERIINDYFHSQNLRILDDNKTIYNREDLDQEFDSFRVVEVKGQFRFEQEVI